MANTKRLKAAAAKFRRTEPHLHSLYSFMIDRMARVIKKSGAAEVTCKLEYDVIRNTISYECYAR